MPFFHVDWSGSDEDTEYHCYWKLTYSPDLEQDLEEIKQWTDRTAKTRGDISLTRCGPTSQELEIIGIGRDGRSTWCRSFRTALESRIGKPFRQRGKCVLLTRKW